MTFPYKIISGGQTGADFGALLAAQELQIPTGGYAPRGYRTEIGSMPILKEFGLIETASDGFPERTRLNAEMASITVWYGKIRTPGYWATVKYANYLMANPSADELRAALQFDETKILNVAGNRESTNPGIQLHTYRSIIGALNDWRAS